ncbi:MAG: Sigma factor RpoE negative regulatory protein RseA [Pseudomonadota bacterium]|jgi:sigma-E factor negative regulatory protein RseA
MGKGESSKQQISVFADGELPNDEVPTVMAALRAAHHARDWDVYHQIGDVLRSETLAAPVSAGFAERFAARFAAEPPLLAPKPRLVDRLRPAWPVAAAAMAAALTGFVIAPQFMHGDATDLRTVPTAQSASQSAVVAQTDLPATTDDMYVMNDYIRIHHSSHPSMYGAAQLVQPVDLKTDSDH